MTSASYILGVHQSGPISSAALLGDGKIIAASPEERFSRIKHDRSFPHRAIDFCLRRAGIGYEDLAEIAIGWNPGENAALKYRPGFSDWMRYPGEWLASVPNHLLSSMNRTTPFEVTGTESIFRLGQKGVPDRAVKIHYIDHHTCHARLALETSGFDSCAVVVIDGFSEQKVTSAYHARNGKIELVHREVFPNSLGCFFAAMTDYLGYRPFSDEWKVMGMAAYGDASRVASLDPLIGLVSEGSYELDLGYFDFFNFDRPKAFSKKLESLLGPARQENENLSRRHFDAAAATQNLLEKTLSHYFGFVRRLTGEARLAFSGGVAMNCLFNGKIVDRNLFSRVHIPFAPDDSGNSIGAALERARANGSTISLAGQTPALGADAHDDQIGAALDRFKLRAKRPAELPRYVARLLAEDKVVGWVRGRSEFGQRALGHRSIFASPCKPGMKDRLNQAVKYRESYRPFAPMLPLDRVKDFFTTQDLDSVRYMEKAFTFRDSVRGQVPSVVHHDGTGRVQTVTPSEEPELHQILCEFESLTGVPVILNTSFNLAGEPIVNSVEDSLKTFITSGIDAIVMGEFVIEKPVF